jgi:hypothetical protein
VLTIFLSAPIHANPRCDNDAYTFLNYYATELPKKLISATPDQLTQLVATEIENAEENSRIFDNACISPQIVKGNDTPDEYRETHKLLLNAKSYLSVFQIYKNRNEVKRYNDDYCAFVSRGVTKFPKCMVRNEADCKSLCKNMSDKN